MFEIYWVYVLVFLLGVHEIYLFNRRFTKFGGKDFGFLKYKKIRFYRHSTYVIKMFMYFIAQFLTCRGPINKGKQKDMQWWTFWKQRYTSLRLFISENNPKLSICYIQCIYLQSFSIYIYSFILFFSHPRKFSYGNKKDSADKVAEGLLEYVFDQSMALLYLSEASIDWQQSSATTSPIRILRITPHSSARNSFICRNGFTKSRSWCTWKTIFCI